MGCDVGDSGGASENRARSALYSADLRSAGSWPCYDLQMARPFHVKVVPPPPLTVDETAEEYGVSRAKSKLLKDFAAGVVLKLPPGTTSDKTHVVVFRPAARRLSTNLRSVRAGARKSAKSSRSVSAKKK